MNSEIELSNIKIRISFRFPETIRYFGPFITQDDCSSWDVRVEDEDLARYPLICPKGELNPFSESYLLIPRVSAYLLRKDAVIIHGVSFLWHGKAWLITAPSGTGKTTQLHHWQKILGEELTLINGDKTVLSMHDDGTFWLHPGPWTGKERESGTASGKLGGIVVLEQDAGNAIMRLPPRESVLRVFQQFMLADSSEEELLLAGHLEEMLIREVPVWLLKNRGDADSACLTIHAIESFEEGTDEEI